MNRNQINRRRNGGLPDSTSKSIFRTVANTGFADNFITEIKKFLKHFHATPMLAIAGIFSFFGSIAAIVDTILSHFGSSPNKSNINTVSTNDVMSFPLGVLIFVVITGSLSWFVSMIGVSLTTRITEVRVIFAHIFTALGAIVMTVYIELIFERDITGPPSAGLVFSIVGVTLAIFIAKTCFRCAYETNTDIIAIRAGLLLNFATVATALVVYSKFSILSL